MVQGIRDKQVFSGFDRNAIRSTSGPITLVRNDHFASPEVVISFAIPRRVGSAVVRNRLRRQLRAIADQMISEGTIGDGAYLLIVRPSAKGSEFAQLREWFSEAVRRLSPNV